MKTIAIFMVICLFSFNTYSFWIWSAKTKDWKNPKSSLLATPHIQLKEAMKYFDKKEYKQAHKEFKRLLTHYPDAKEAAEGQYYLGRCLEEMSQPYQAFLEYKKVIDTYPNSKRINEIIKRQYDIGIYFLNREPKTWLGVSVYNFVEHPGIEIFKNIVEKTPYSQYAPITQYKLGVLFTQLGYYEEAREAFQKVIDNYPESDWIPSAKYQLAVVVTKGSPGTDYDTTSLKEATRRLDEFIDTYDDGDISSEAKGYLKKLKDQEARKDFETAQFYEKQEKYKAARMYYDLLIKKHPQSEYARFAKERIRGLDNSQGEWIVIPKAKK